MQLLSAQCVQRGQILGTDSVAIDGVQVVLQDESGTQGSTLSDSEGSFELQTQFESGTLIVFRRGYTTVETDWTCDAEILLIQLESLNLNLDAVQVESENRAFLTRSLRTVEGMSIYAGKKSEVISPRDVMGNKSANSARQIFGKVAGLNIWESDAGLQLGIGGRGLSPNRTANFNTRQNGYDISADALGYPESYYTPPTEALERIEVVRGAASLQYGTQFGGLLNFVLRTAPEEKTFEIEASQTVGAFGYLGTYASAGVQTGDWTAFGFGQFRRGNGWRPNSDFDQYTIYGSVSWQPGKSTVQGADHKLSLSATKMHYLAQQAGGLTDANFEEDARQSVRDRNWFAVDWNLLNLSYDWKLSPQTRINVRNFGLIASKDALGYLGQINRTDPGENRDLLADRFRNFGNESRVLHRYQIGDDYQAMVAGIRIYRGNTARTQGDANALSGPDFEYLNPDTPERFSIVFPSLNFAAFAEHAFQFGKFFVTPGIRFETITTESDGYYRQITEDLAGNILLDTTFDESLTLSRSFVLGGIGAGYRWNSFEVYANISQNYRAITFNDLRVSNPNLVVDENLEDEKGFSADLGFRGIHSDWLRMDMSLFAVLYKNRIGNVLTSDPVTFRTYRFRTNVADSRTAGVEVVLEADLLQMAGKRSDFSLSLWTNTSLVHAQYINAQEPAVDGKEVELVPPATVRAGFRTGYKGFKLDYQVGWTARHYTDATNAEFTPTATAGLIPTYYVMDLTASYARSFYRFETGVTNLTNSLYFTRRATGYPGPGIIPSDGRGWFFTFSVRV